MTIIEQMALDLRLDEDYLKILVQNSKHKYRRITIPKRNGKLRVIFQPVPEVKMLQYWLVEKIISKLPVSNVSYAYGKGCSIKKHALIHIGKNHILHIDIEDFFNSINIDGINSLIDKNKELIFAKTGFDIQDIKHTLCDVCCKDSHILIGSVSAPFISNAYMYNFDLFMSEYCLQKKMTYSRYADDMYISSMEYIEPNFLGPIRETLEKIHLKININKTRYMSKAGQRKITGIILTDEKKISIGLALRKSIKKLLYEKIVLGKGDSNRILGYLSYLKDIEPNTYNNFVIKYSKNLGEKNFMFELMKDSNT